MARASRCIRVRVSSSRANWGRISFTARSTSSSRCQTSQTSPIPPSPRRLMTSNLWGKRSWTLSRSIPESAETAGRMRCQILVERGEPLESLIQHLLVIGEPGQVLLAP